MTQGVSGVKGALGQQTPNRDAYGNISLDNFMQLLVTELRYQDPMDPVKNSEILQQVGQIESLDSTRKLNKTMDSVFLGQNMSTASNLLHRQITALDDTGNKVTGNVDSVTIGNGSVKVHVGNSTVSLKNISEISASTTTADDVLANLYSYISGAGGGNATGG